MTKFTLLKTFLFALTLLVSNVVWGADVEFIFANQGYTNAQDVPSGTINSDLLFSVTGGSNPAKYYDTGTGLRIYTGGSFIISPQNGATVTNIALTFAGSTYTFNTADANPTVWTGSSTTGITFSVTRTSRLQKINITYSPVESSIVSTPTITPSGALNSTDNYFNTASITLSSTTVGAEIRYTTNGDVPTASSTLYNAPFDITSTSTIKAIAIKSGLDNSSVAEKTITITAVTAPTITVTQVTVPDMTAVTGLTDSEVLTVTGTALTADVAITIDGTNASMFSVSPESLTNTNGSASGSVTVTYNPTAPGTHTATLRFNSADATEVIRTLNGTSAMATPIATDATGITTSGFNANWNAVAGATDYELSVYTKSVSPSNAPSDILNEDFRLFSAGTNTITDGTDVSTTLDTYTQTAGWTGSKVYQSGGSVKMGVSSSLGYITTPALNLSASNLTLSFKTMAWTSDATEMKIYLDDVLLYTATGLDNTNYTFTPFSAALTGGTASSKIKFEGKQAIKGRFFLDDVVISASGGTSTSTPIDGSPFTVTGTNSKAIIGLAENTNYYYKVIAKNGSTVTAASNEVSVITSNSTGLHNATQNFQLRSINGSIVLNTNAGMMVEVYNSVGQRVANQMTTEGANTISVRAKGVVFVKIGVEVSKLIME